MSSEAFKEVHGRGALALDTYLHAKDLDSRTAKSPETLLRPQDSMNSW